MQREQQAAECPVVESKWKHSSRIGSAACAMPPPPARSTAARNSPPE